MAGVSSSISSAAAVHAGSPFKALEAATCPEILGIFQSKNSKFDVDGHQQPQQQPRLPDRILFSCSFNNDRLLNFRGFDSSSINSVSAAFTVIFYSRPNTRLLQYYSVIPLSLDITPWNHYQHVASSLNTFLGSQLQHTVGSLRNPHEGLDLILDSINASYMYNKLSTSKESTWTRFIDSLDLATLLPNLIYNTYTRPLFRLFRWIIGCLLWILNINLFKLDVCLKDLFTSVEQLEVRLQQASFWPRTYLKWRNTPAKLCHKPQSLYLGFYNMVWLVANDLIIGYSVGVFLTLNSGYVSDVFILWYRYLCLDSVKVLITWLSQYPAGLKLNTELVIFLGDLFLWLVNVWDEIITNCTSSLPDIIETIGLIGTYAGASMSISLFSDLVSISTSHLYLFYLVARRIYAWQVGGILSLFTLFRGKKRNILRNRVDSAEYDLDQLLLGTIMFSVLVFLFPTVAAYYILFSGFRVTVVFVQIVLEFVLVVINHFPLFVLMLRFKDPARLPAGICFEPTAYIPTTEHAIASVIWYRLRLWLNPLSGDSIHSQEASNTGPLGKNDNNSKDGEEGCVSYLTLKTVPIGMVSIFHQYQVVLGRLFTFYFSLDKLNRLLSGEKILLFSRRRENISSVSVPVVSPSPTTKVGAVGEGSSSSGGGSSSRSSPLKQHSASPLLMRSYTSPLAHSPAWKKNE